jgi:hypothetical protein
MIFFPVDNSEKNGLDVGMAFYGFFQHLGHVFFKNVGVTRLPSCRVMSSPLSFFIIVTRLPEFTSKVINVVTQNRGTLYLLNMLFEA